MIPSTSGRASALRRHSSSSRRRCSPLTLAIAPASPARRFPSLQRPSRHRPSASFNGTNDYVTFGTAHGARRLARSPSRPGSSGRARARRRAPAPAASTTAIPLVTKGRAEAESSQRRHELLPRHRRDSGKLVADFEEGAGRRFTRASTTRSPAPPSSRQNVVAPRRGHLRRTGTWKLYLDGVVDGTLGRRRDPRPAVGQHPARGHRHRHDLDRRAPRASSPGDIDEVRIWNVVRSQAADPGRDELRADVGDRPARALGAQRGHRHDRRQLDRRQPERNADERAHVGRGFPSRHHAARRAGRTRPRRPATASSGSPGRANAEPDLAGYNVYRSTTGRGDHRDTAQRLDAPDDAGLHRHDRRQRHDLPLRRDRGGQRRQPVRPVRRGQRDAERRLPAPPSTSTAQRLRHVRDGDRRSGRARSPLETWFKWTGAGATTSTGHRRHRRPPSRSSRRVAAEDESSNVDMNYFLGIQATASSSPTSRRARARRRPGSTTRSSARTAITTEHVAPRRRDLRLDHGTWTLYLDGVVDGTLVVGANRPRGRTASSTPASAPP